MEKTCCAHMFLTRFWGAKKFLIKWRLQGLGRMLRIQKNELQVGQSQKQARVDSDAVANMKVILLSASYVLKKVENINMHASI